MRCNILELPDRDVRLQVLCDGRHAAEDAGAPAGDPLQQLLRDTAGRDHHQRPVSGRLPAHTRHLLPFQSTHRGAHQQISFSNIRASAVAQLGCTAHCLVLLD